MKACENPCSKCPWLRGSEIGLPDEEDPFEYWEKYVCQMEPYICPEGEDVCIGQLKYMAWHSLKLYARTDEFRDLIINTKPENHKYLASDFVGHHLGLRKPPEPKPKLPIQGSLF